MTSFWVLGIVYIAKVHMHAWVISISNPQKKKIFPLKSTWAILLWLGVKAKDKGIMNFKNWNLASLQKAIPVPYEMHKVEVCERPRDKYYLAIAVDNWARPGGERERDSNDSPSYWRRLSSCPLDLEVGACGNIGNNKINKTFRTSNVVPGGGLPGTFLYT